MRSAITVCLVPEAAAGPFVYHGDLASGCARAAAAGFDAIELFPGAADEVDAHVLRELLHRHDLQLAAVGTGAGWVRHKLSLTSPDGAVRLRAREFIGSIVDLAGGFGAPAILGSMQGRAEGTVNREQALEWLTEAIEQFGPRAAAHGTTFLVEPLNRYESNLLNQVEQGVAFLDALRTRAARLLCDFFHMNIEEASIGDALRRAGPRVGHIHFADSNRRAVGLGHTDFADPLAALRDIGYQGYLSAEILPQPSADEAAARTLTAFHRFIQPRT